MRFLILVAALAALPIASDRAAAQTYSIQLAPGETLLRVAAEGSVKARPDSMTITAGVVTTGRTALEALSANSTLSGRLVAAARARGLAAADLRTEALSLEPRFARDAANEEDRARIAGYTATNKVELRVRAVERAPELISALFEAGANSVDGPRFFAADNELRLGQAREAAIRVARDHAETYARALGMRITRVLRVSDYGGSGDVLNGLPAVYANRSPATPIEPGEIETTGTVWIDFALLPAS